MIIRTEPCHHLFLPPSPCGPLSGYHCIVYSDRERTFWRCYCKEDGWTKDAIEIVEKRKREMDSIKYQMRELENKLAELKKKDELVESIAQVITSSLSVDAPYHQAYNTAENIIKVLEKQGKLK